MILRVRLTGLRREILSVLTPGQGIAADALKRRVAQARRLSPESPGWPAFKTSFARALRLLEARGVLEVRREQTLFADQACATWVALTETGRAARARALAPGEQALGDLGDDALAALARLLEDATDRELERVPALLEAERRRRRPE